MYPNTAVNQPLSRAWRLNPREIKIYFLFIYLSLWSELVAVTVPLEKVLEDSVVMIEDATQGHTRDIGPLSED